MPVTARPPPFDVKTTGILARKRFWVSRTIAVIVADSELSDGMVGVLVVSVRLPTTAGGCAATTATGTVAENVPVAAVTVMLRIVLSPAVLSVAVTCPLASVVAEPGVMPPELVEKVTVTFGSSALLAARTKAVMVAV